MKILAVGLSISFSIMLAGCASSNHQWERPNTSEAQMLQDSLECENQVAKNFPVVMVSTGTGHQLPAEAECISVDGELKCRTKQGLYMAPRQKDVNFDKRAYAHSSCLMRIGYTLVQE